MAFYAVENLAHPQENTSLQADKTYTIEFSVPYEMLDVDWNTAEENVIRLYAGRSEGSTIIKDQTVVTGSNVFSFRLSDYSLQNSGVTGISILISSRILIDGSFYSLYFYDLGDSARNTLVYAEPVFTTDAGAPSAPKFSSTLSREAATLSWGAGSAGTGNAVTGYDVEYADSADGSSWGSWQTLSGSPVTGTSISISPPATVGHYRKCRVRTRGSAGSDYYSGWVESANTLRRKWNAFGSFTDEALTAGVSMIRAIHLTELQERVNAIRAFYGLSAYGFTSVTARKTKIAKWADLILEIRTAIDGVTTDHESYNTLSAGRPRIAHITQLRRIIDGM